MLAVESGNQREERELHDWTQDDVLFEGDGRAAVRVADYGVSIQNGTSDHHISCSTAFTTRLAEHDDGS